MIRELFRSTKAFKIQDLSEFNDLFSKFRLVSHFPRMNVSELILSAGHTMTLANSELKEPLLLFVENNFS